MGYQHYQLNPADQNASRTAGAKLNSEREGIKSALIALTPRIKNGKHLMLPLVHFALETAMRRGEILGLRWSMQAYKSALI